MKSLESIIRRSVNLIEETREVDVDLLNRSIYKLIQSADLEDSSFNYVSVLVYYSGGRFKDLIK
jgi:hypothetical protein